MKDVVIVGGVRTAVGAFGGSLKNTPVVDLGALVIREALTRLNLKPVVSSTMAEVAPDALRGSGTIELEQSLSELAGRRPGGNRGRSGHGQTCCRPGRDKTRPARP